LADSSTEMDVHPRPASWSRPFPNRSRPVLSAIFLRRDGTAVVNSGFAGRRAPERRGARHRPGPIPAHADDAEGVFPARCGGRASRLGDQTCPGFSFGQDRGRLRIIRRGTARISAMVMSAVSSVRNFRRVGDGDAAGHARASDNRYCRRPFAANWRSGRSLQSG